jgi:hypothetical protein
MLIMSAKRMSDRWSTENILELKFKLFNEKCKLAKDICFETYMRDRVEWVPCHHGMARPQVADGGDGLQIQKSDANMSNMQAVADSQQGVILQVAGWA